MIGSLFQTVRNTEWGYLLDFVSPTFFEVVPLSGMLFRTGHLLTSYLQPWPDYEFSLPPDIELNQERNHQKGFQRLSDANKKKIGERILTLYFWQILHSDRTILDLRPQTFDVKADSRKIKHFSWSPHALIADWDPRFIHAVRDIYLGFHEADWALFDKGLEKMGLLPAREIFLENFTQGVDEMDFDIKKFVMTFHDIFIACRKARKQIHADFLYLGVYLATLHESLECLGGRFNVRKAFEKAMKKTKN